jgi:hypothetical protein
MELPQTPEPYVGSTALRAYLGGISNLTLHRWLAQGMPVRRVGPRGRMLFKLSEIDAWLDAFVEFGCTANTPGRTTDDVGAA